MPKTEHLRGGQPTRKISLSLTQQEVEKLDALAKKLDLSRSALIGMIAVGQLPLLAPEELLLGES